MEGWKARANPPQNNSKTSRKREEGLWKGSAPRSAQCSGIRNIVRDAWFVLGYQGCISPLRLRP
jgi:hypothetical protein